MQSSNRGKDSIVVSSDHGNQREFVRCHVGGVIGVEVASKDVVISVPDTFKASSHIAVEVKSKLDGNKVGFWKMVGVSAIGSAYLKSLLKRCLSKIKIVARTSPYPQRQKP
ncbi:hypothetical protein V6N12_009901 [Hibiscus sabdariffa]|uniref:Uncharacterized protein n=1 Tax=Hibiscus sabdariffa TaxID=183260 RepID=A0ABR2EC30_9ROSI